MDFSEQSVLATLVYYDVLDKPLTSWEVFKYLIKPKSEYYISFIDVASVLKESPEILELISEKNGFYFLKGREELVEERIARQKRTEKKWKKLKKICRLLEIIPFIRMVMISGSLALNNSREDSDIDLLVVTKKGRLWSSRAAAAFLSYIFKQYRHGRYIKNRLCLNHFIVDSCLKIPCFSLYNAQTYAHLIPLWQTEDIFNSFHRENSWLKNYLCFYQKGQYLERMKSSSVLRLVRQTAESALSNTLGDSLENYLKKIQKNWFENDPLRYEPGGRIVFNDNQLEFHNNSPERRIIERYNQKMQQLGLNVWAREKDSGLTI